MDIIIRETGERKQLKRIHPGTDYDAAVDTLNAYGALDDGQFEDTLDGALTCSGATFDAWSTALGHLSAVDHRIAGLVAAYGSSTVDNSLAGIGNFKEPSEEVTALSLALDNAFAHNGAPVDCYYDLASAIERNGTLPENFDQWHLADETGWTLAHVAATRGRLPDDFHQWDMADDSLTTVAHVAAEFGNLPPEFDQKHLIAQKAGDTKNLWPTTTAPKGPKL